MRLAEEPLVRYRETGPLLLNKAVPAAVIAGLQEAIAELTGLNCDVHARKAMFDLDADQLANH
jgi:hypothetical protein